MNLNGGGGARKGSGRPKGKPNTKPQVEREATAALKAIASQILHGPSRREGLTLYQNTIRDLLVPVVAPVHDWTPKCETCGRSAEDYLVNAKTMLGTIEHLASRSEGLPTAKLEMEKTFRYVLEGPPEMSKEDWLAQYTDAQEKIAAIDSGERPN